MDELALPDAIRWEFLKVMVSGMAGRLRHEEVWSPSIMDECKRVKVVRMIAWKLLDFMNSL